MTKVLTQMIILSVFPFISVKLLSALGFIKYLTPEKPDFVTAIGRTILILRYFIRWTNDEYISPWWVTRTAGKLRFLTA